MKLMSCNPASVNAIEGDSSGFTLTDTSSGKSNEGDSLNSFLMLWTHGYFDLFTDTDLSRVDPEGYPREG
jgi:hypothetical protein